MKTNVGLSTISLRTVLAAAMATLSVSAASVGEDSHASKHYVLPATAENVQWGWYDINEKPKLTIHSGDTRLHRNPVAFAGADQTRRGDG